MDYSWIHDNPEVDSSDSEFDAKEKQTELEDRLYSIVHHNDLSQPLPPELAKHYSVHCDDSGEIVVSLNNTLEDVKLEECKNVGHLLDSLDSNCKVADVSVADISGLNDRNVSGIKKVQDTRNRLKRFRYSDINLDSPNTFQESKEVDLKSTIKDINFFQFSPNLFTVEKNKQFADLVIPKSFNFEPLNWKINANSSFISIGPKNNADELKITKEMANALSEVNPGVKKRKLFRCAQLLYRKNMKTFRRRERLKDRKRKINGSEKPYSLSLENKDNFKNSEIQAKILNNGKDISRLKRKDRLSGSISLNISPFRPYPPTVDLVSEEESTPIKDSSTRTRTCDLSVIDFTSDDRKKTPVKSNHSSSKSSKKLLHSHIPDKWSKSMIKFYTAPSKKLIATDLNAVFKNMEKTTTAKDWQLDPRDQSGIYQRTTPKGKYANRRCPNCNERGHLIRDCPKPQKIPACSLCGEFYHTDYSCPNRICMKCGVFLQSNAFNGECDTCYYSTFESDVPCNVCGKVTHRSSVCPDLWRSFHATTSGEKKIPATVNQNKLKYCCNCARKGHFSHNCPFLSYAGQQISPFVTNYSAQPLEKGSAEIVISQQFSDIVNNKDTDTFLQNLSNSTCAEIQYDQRDKDFVFRISGTFEQCKIVKTEIEGYVNTRKRKRFSPLLKKKKQRLKY